MKPIELSLKVTYMNSSQSDENRIDCSILQILFDSSPQAVLIIEDGKVVYTNSALAHAVGFKPQQVVGQEVTHIVSMIGMQDYDSVVSRFSAISAGKMESDKERFHFKDAEGSRYVLEFSAKIIEADNKRYVVLYGNDVTGDELSKETLATERRAYSVIAEAALSSDKLPQICDRILRGLIETLRFDLGTIRLYDAEDCTLKLMTSYGIEKGGTPETIALEDPNFLVARTARTKSPLFTQDIEMTPESEDRMVRARNLGVRTLIFWPILGSEENLLGVINVATKEPIILEQEQRTVFATIAGMFSTILERRKTEEELQEFKDRFTAFADNMPGPVYLKDDKSKVLFVNRYMREATQKATKANWEGLSNLELFPKERAENLTEEDLRILVNGPIDRIQETMTDGEIRTFRTHKFPIIREGKPPLIGGFSIDITDRIVAEKQREEARARAIWMSDLMAHDINNLHQGIMSSLELMLEDEQFPRHLMGIAQNALLQVNRSVSLINNVKKFSVVNQEELVLEKTDPAESLIAAIQTVKQSFPQRKISITTNLETGKYCIMSNTFLHDVFFNLLHNAVKYTVSESVRIDVTTSLVEEGKFIRFDFEDWGQGIDDRFKKSILTGINDRVHRVSGVGLTLVKQIVDQYGGSISVENREKGDFTKGTRFIIKLPNGC